MAEEVVVRNLPAIGARVAEHHYVPDPDPVHWYSPRQHVLGSAQFTGDGDRLIVHLRPGMWQLPVVDRHHGKRVAVLPGSWEPEVVGIAAQMA